MSYNRITVPLSEDEENVLRLAASQSCRRPRDYARYIILKSLGLVSDDGPSPKMNNRQAASTLTETSSKAVGSIYP
jgi:hypothetical protein